MRAGPVSGQADRQSSSRTRLNGARECERATHHVSGTDRDRRRQRQNARPPCEATPVVSCVRRFQSQPTLQLQRRRRGNSGVGRLRRGCGLPPHTHTRPHCEVRGGGVIAVTAWRTRRVWMARCRTARVGAGVRHRWSAAAAGTCIFFTAAGATLPARGAAALLPRRHVRGFRRRCAAAARAAGEAVVLARGLH